MLLIWKTQRTESRIRIGSRWNIFVNVRNGQDNSVIYCINHQSSVNLRKFKLDGKENLNQRIQNFKKY